MSSTHTFQTAQTTPSAKQLDDDRGSELRGTGPFSSMIRSRLMDTATKAGRARVPVAPPITQRMTRFMEFNSRWSWVYYPMHIDRIVDVLEGISHGGTGEGQGQGHRCTQPHWRDGCVGVLQPEGARQADRL